MNAPRNRETSPSRRRFLKQSGVALAGATLAGSLARRVHAAEDNTIKIGLIGCGGRGTGAAAQALSTAGPTTLVAMADVFDYRLAGSLKRLSGQFKDKKDKVDVPKERQFLGMDAYKKAIEAVGPGGIVLLTTPPGFRPLHLEHAVAQGRHVFMEKSFAVDGPGVRRVLKAGEEAKKKNLKIAGGLMERHYLPLEETVKRIHDGAIGKVITLWSYREHGPVGYGPRKEGESILANQIRNYSCYTWLNGSFLLDWLIHNLDVACWVKDAWPVSAQGQGGRQCRKADDQLFDHYAVEYSFADGTRMFAQGRHMSGCFGEWCDIVHGATGSARVGEGVNEPKIYNGHLQTAANEAWRYKGPPCNHYQREHDLLFAAIRQDQPYNEAERCAKTAMVGILGRMAAESGKQITWEQALASNLKLAPELDTMTMESPAPIQPDKEGKYAIAMPGFTNVL